MRTWFYPILLILCTNTVQANLSGSLSKEAIEQRLKPDANIHLISEPDKADTPTNKISSVATIYDANCKTCHASGLAGAPKFRNKKDWQPRVKQGIKVMTTKAVQGFKAMPPKGNCLDCSEEDLRRTIEYMIEKLN